MQVSVSARGGKAPSELSRLDMRVRARAMARHRSRVLMVMAWPGDFGMMLPDVEHGCWHEDHI